MTGELTGSSMIEKDQCLNVLSVNKEAKTKKSLANM